jgi:predicted dehydrogenase
VTTDQTLRVVLNGVTDRAGYRRHLPSVLAIRAQGGVPLADGNRAQLEPILVGHSAPKLREIAARHGVREWTTDLDQALSDRSATVYFDGQPTPARAPAVIAALAAGKHVYAEQPLAETTSEALELARLAAPAGLTNGVVHSQLYLPGLRKLRRLLDAGFFGRVLSVRGEFGYWVFEGDWQRSQRPSWNYRAEDGGGIVADVFGHWNYVLELFGQVRAVTARAVTHLPERWDEDGKPYTATAADAVYAIYEVDGGIVAQINSSWCVRVDRDDLVEFQVDGTHGSAVAGLHRCRVQHRVSTPMASWNPDVPTDARFMDDWLEVPDNTAFPNGFRAQWEEFVRDVVAGAPHSHDFLAGARGVALAEAGLRSSAEGRRVALEPIVL